jgi:hypothetical protein
VTFATADEAQRALTSPTFEIDGRVATVSLAAAGKAMPVAGAPSGLAVSSNDISARKLFVRQLNFESTEASVRAYFSQFGELQEVFLFRDRVSLLSCLTCLLFPLG